MKFIVTVSKGLEEIVAGELLQLNINFSDITPGIVSFKGKLEEAWKANLWLRTARKVLWVFGEFETYDVESLYFNTLNLQWNEILTPDTTFCVEASINNSIFTHSGFVALKVKDAIADSMRKTFNSRPNVDKSNPDVRIVVYINDNKCTISIDLSGGPLHKRGYRIKNVTAPINETLAAGILLISGYNGSVDFFDPFCGSGTFPIEAALIATNTAPGLIRKKPFGFEKLPTFNKKIWNNIIEEAKCKISNPQFQIYGSDINKSAINIAKENAHTAGVDKYINFSNCSFEDVTPENEKGIICMNPPYGDRMGIEEDLFELYQEIGNILKKKFDGWNAYIIAGNLNLAKKIGLHAKRRIKLYNGPMECRLLIYDLYKGSKKNGNNFIQ